MAASLVLTCLSLVSGDSECACSDALSSVLSEDTLRLDSIGEIGYFCVCGKYEWSSSRFSVNEGEKYSFSVEGDQKWSDYNHLTSASGYSSKWMKLICCDEQWTNMRQHIGSLRYPSHPFWGALICCLGRTEDPTDTESCFAVNDEPKTKLIANLPGNDQSTTIECYANDIANFYGDNDGALRVTIQRKE